MTGQWRGPSEGPSEGPRKAPEVIRIDVNAVGVHEAAELLSKTGEGLPLYRVSATPAQWQVIRCIMSKL